MASQAACGALDGERASVAGSPMHADCPPRMLLWEWLQPRAFPCRPGRHGFVISALSCEAGEGGAKRRVRVGLLKYPGKRKPALKAKARRERKEGDST